MNLQVSQRNNSNIWLYQQLSWSNSWQGAFSNEDKLRSSKRTLKKILPGLTLMNVSHQPWLIVQKAKALNKPMPISASEYRKTVETHPSNNENNSKRVYKTTPALIQPWAAAYGGLDIPEVGQDSQTSRNQES